MYSRMLHPWPAIAAALLIATLQIDVFAQVSEKADEPLDWWGNIDGFLNRQHSHVGRRRRDPRPIPPTAGRANRETNGIARDR